MRKSEKENTPKPHYGLKDIKDKIRRKEYVVPWPVHQSAWKDFRWKVEDIEKVYLRLSPFSFDITIENKNNRKLMDVYKIRNFEGENIYTKFYVHDSGKLIITSLKKL